MLGIPPLKRLECKANFKLEPFTVEHKASMNKITTPKLVYLTSHATDPVTERYHSSLEKIADHQNVPSKLEDSIDANIGEAEFASKQNIEDFVSKALDSFLDIQEKIKVLESVPVEDQTQEHIDNLLCLKN